MTYCMGGRVAREVVRGDSLGVWPPTSECANNREDGQILRSSLEGLVLAVLRGPHRGLFATLLAELSDDDTVHDVGGVKLCGPDPLQVYLSLRPSGGAWGATELLPLEEFNERKTYRFSDRTVPVPWPELVEDAEALLAWRERLGGAATFNWNAGLPMSQWTGVTIAGTPQRVTKLELANVGLTGELSGLVGELTGLKEMRLNGNALRGRIPSRVALLTGLTHVYLGGNTLTGCMPPSLRAVANNDLVTLGVPDCGPPVDISHPLGYEAADLTAGTYQFTTGEDAPRLVFDIPDGLRLTIVGAALQDAGSVHVPALTLREAGGHSWIALDFRLGQIARSWAEEPAVDQLFDRISTSLWLGAPSSAAHPPREEPVPSIPPTSPPSHSSGRLKRRSKLRFASGWPTSWRSTRSSAVSVCPGSPSTSGTSRGCWT